MVPGNQLEMRWEAKLSSGNRQWDVQPSWAGIVYGNGRPGSGTESMVPPGVVAWPISPRTAEMKKPEPKKIATHLKFYGSESITETMTEHGVKELPLSAYATDAPEGRRMTDELRALIHQLRQQGCVVEAIGSTLNLKTARVQRVLSEPL